MNGTYVHVMQCEKQTHITYSVANVHTLMLTIWSLCPSLFTSFMDLAVLCTGAVLISQKVIDMPIIHFQSCLDQDVMMQGWPRQLNGGATVFKPQYAGATSHFSIINRVEFRTRKCIKHVWSRIDSYGVPRTPIIDTYYLRHFLVCTYMIALWTCVCCRSARLNPHYAHAR